MSGLHNRYQKLANRNLYMKADKSAIKRYDQLTGRISKPLWWLFSMFCIWALIQALGLFRIPDSIKDFSGTHVIEVEQKAVSIGLWDIMLFGALILVLIMLLVVVNNAKQQDTPKSNFVHWLGVVSVIVGIVASVFSSIADYHDTFVKQSIPVESTVVDTEVTPDLQPFALEKGPAPSNETDANENPDTQQGDEESEDQAFQSKKHSYYSCSVTVDNAYGPPEKYEFTLQGKFIGTPIEITDINFHKGTDDTGPIGYFDVVHEGTVDETTTYFWDFNGCTSPAFADLKSPEVILLDETLARVRVRE